MFKRDVDLSKLGGDKAAWYARLQAEMTAVVEGERDFIANMANCAALLFHSLPDLNWAGFYLLRGRDLVLGPFQGQLACVRIGPGKGVCGAAAQRRATVVVKDVHQFPGHIACDSASNSEIVVPLMVGGRLIGVMDLDSPSRNRFDEVDAEGLERIAGILLRGSEV